MRLKAVTRCLLRLQETPTQLQKLPGYVQLLPKTLLGSILISELKANRADRSVKFEEEVVAKHKLAIDNRTATRDMAV